MADRLAPDALDSAVAALAAWRLDDNHAGLVRDFVFADFSEAFGFMARVALAAQQADHHPDWSNSYNRVRIILTTHSAGGVTDKDIALAKAIDSLVG